MTYKKPKDAAIREAQFVEPIRFDKKSDTPTIKENLVRENSEKVEPMRENKQSHQHTYRHNKILRKTIPRNSV